MLPAQLGLARCCILPLNRNCEAWPATSFSPELAGAVTPLTRGRELGARPSLNSSLSLPAPSLRGGLAEPVQHLLTSAPHPGAWEPGGEVTQGPDVGRDLSTEPHVGE